MWVCRGMKLDSDDVQPVIFNVPSYRVGLNCFVQFRTTVIVEEVINFIQYGNSMNGEVDSSVLKDFYSKLERTTMDVVADVVYNCRGL